jgi:hypothetical protein
MVNTVELPPTRFLRFSANNTRQPKGKTMDRLVVDTVLCGTHDGCGYEVEAHTPEGRRFHLRCDLLSEDVAHRLVDKIERVGTIDPSLWGEGYPVYGSPAFVSDEAAASHWADRVRHGHCDLDSVPDCYRTLL